MQLANDIMNFVNVADHKRFVFNLPVRVVAIWWKPFTFRVWATVDISTFFDPLLEASIHDTNIASPKEP